MSKLVVKLLPTLGVTLWLYFKYAPLAPSATTLNITMAVFALAIYGFLSGIEDIVLRGK